jgi:hypothetical protein
MAEAENKSAKANANSQPLTYAGLFRWSVFVVFIILGVALAFAIKETLLLFAIAFLIAMVLNPGVTLLERALFKTESRRHTPYHRGVGDIGGDCPIDSAAFLRAAAAANRANSKRMEPFVRSNQGLDQNVSRSSTSFTQACQRHAQYSDWSGRWNC